MSSVFNDHTDAFERLILLGVLPPDHKQRDDFDYSTQLKGELLKRENNKTTTHVGKPVGKRRGKHIGKLKQVNPPIPPDVGKPPMSVGELIKSRKNAEWIVDGFGAQGALLMIAADVGTGKTTLLYSLATAIGKGKTFLLNAEGIGQLTTQKRKVLFVQADETKNDCWRKCKIMGLKDDEFDFVFGEDGWEILDLPRLEKIIDKGNYGVVMLDSVTTLLGNEGISMKDPEFAKPLYALNQLASKKQVLIVITAHLRKPENSIRKTLSMHDILGAGTQPGAVSDVWGLSRQENTSPNDCKFVLTCLEKARNCDVGTRWNLRGSKEDLSWVFESVGGSDELLPSVKKDLKNYATLHLQESDEWRSVKDIAIYFHKSEEHTRRVLLDLYVEEKIERKNQKLGITVGGRPKWVYRGKIGFPTLGDTGSSDFGKVV